MFAWWISWWWAWLAWACVGAAGTLWADGVLDPDDLLAHEVAGMTIEVDGVHVGPGMGGSALQMMGEKEQAQRFATQPTPQTAVVGSTVVLPCR